MKILIAIAVVVLVTIAIVKLNSHPKPSEKEAKLQILESEIATEISPEFMKQYEGVTIDNEKTKIAIDENKALWNDWLKTGYKPGNKLTVDFYFYSTNEEDAIKLKTILEQEGFHVVVYPESTLIIFRGFKIKTQIRRAWDLETLIQYEKFMTALGEKEGPYLESVAALVK